MNSDCLVFGYGSLVNRESLAATIGRRVEADRFHSCFLHGFRRLWNIASENGSRNSRRYVDEQGRLAAVRLTWLNIEPAEGRRVNGAAFAVSQVELEKLDRREFEYDRIDVTGLLDIETSLPVYTYVGKAEYIRAFNEGKSDGISVVNSYYIDLVREGFSRLGAASLQSYEATTAELTVPCRPLKSEN